jgi:hypothetical protein
MYHIGESDSSYGSGSGSSNENGNSDIVDSVENVKLAVTQLIASCREMGQIDLSFAQDLELVSTVAQPHDWRPTTAGRSGDDEKDEVRKRVSSTLKLPALQTFDNPSDTRQPTTQQPYTNLTSLLDQLRAIR